MPANLTPQYKAAEARYHAAATREEREAALRDMVALLPKHKGTEKLLADLRKRLSKLEDEEAHARRSGHRTDPGHVEREGAGQWVLVGPPNAGKSSLLAALTRARPEVAEYPFTTREPQPGMAEFEDVQLQLVDAPPVAAGHTPAWLTGLVHAADGVLLVLDVAGYGRPPGAPPPGAPPAEPRPVLVLGNKVDLDADGTFAALAREAVGPALPFLPVSAARGDGLDALRPRLFHELGRVRVHTREPGHPPDAGRPFVLPRGATVEDLAARVHHDLARGLRFARLWGAHARFEGQQVDRHHVLQDGDVVELHA